MSGIDHRISNLNKEKIQKALEEDKRLDSRKLDERREIVIETGISKNAEGSARVKLGDTEVVVGVKVEVTEPYTDHEDEGTLITTAELLPLSSERFEYGPPRIEAIELARIVDRGIRESGFIDFKKLCIKKGEKVYAILLDIYSMNDDGNLLDASCLAAVAALLTAKMPKYDDKKETIKYGELTSKSVPLGNVVPLTTTFHKIGDSIIVDPVREEEKAADARLTFALTRKSAKEVLINAAQKSGEAILTQEELEKITDLVTEKFKELEAVIKKQVK
jgi:exosome complex component RRP42